MLNTAVSHLRIHLLSVGFAELCRHPCLCSVAPCNKQRQFSHLSEVPVHARCQSHQSSDSHHQKYSVKHAVLLLGLEFPYQGQRTAGRDSWSLPALTALLRAEAIKAQAVAEGDPRLQMILRYWQKQADLSLLWTHAAAFYPGAPNQAEPHNWCSRKPFTTLQQAARAPQAPGRELPAGGTWQLMRH